MTTTKRNTTELTMTAAIDQLTKIENDAQAAIEAATDKAVRRADAQAVKKAARVYARIPEVMWPLVAEKSGVGPPKKTAPDLPAATSALAASEPPDSAPPSVPEPRTPIIIDVAEALRREEAMRLERESGSAKNPPSVPDEVPEPVYSAERMQSGLTPERLAVARGR